MPSSFNTSGSLSSQPTLGILKNQQPTQSGVLSGMTIPNQTQTQNTGLVSNGQSIQAPVQTGLVSNTSSSNTHIVNTNPQTGATTIKPAPNPSVLAQQQALNKLGAGLVEDGIAGPKTSAAIAKYGTGSTSPTGTSSSSASSAPTKAPDDPSNKYNTATGQLNTNYIDPNAPTPAPVGNTVSSQIGNVANAGQQTPQEAQTYSGLIGQSQAPSQAYLDAQAEAKRVSDEQTKLAEDYAQKTNNIAGTAGFLTQQTGLQGLLNNQYNTVQGALANQYAGATNRLGAANTQQGLQVTAGTAANTAAQTTAGRGLSAANSVLGAVAPITGVPYGTQTIQPGTLGTTGSSGGQVQPNDPFYQTLQSYAQQAASGQYSAIPSSITGNAQLNAQLNQMAKAINPNYNPVTSAAQSTITGQQTGTIAQYQSALQQGQNLQAQLTDLITTFGLNPSDINVANTGLQKIASNVSNPHYKQLQNYVNDIANTYAQILVPPGGSSTDTSRGIATSMLDATASGVSILDTMKSLDNAAKAKIAGVSTSYGGTQSSTSGSTGGSIWSF